MITNANHPPIDRTEPGAIQGNQKGAENGRGDRMTPEQIREAAVAAYDAFPPAKSESECHAWCDNALAAVYRAGMEAGRAESAAAKPKRAKNGESDPCLVSVAEMMRHGVEPVQAESWLRARKAKHLPLTRAAWEQAIAKAERAGITVCRLVEICAGEGWAGFNEAWAVERGLLPRRQAASAETKREREARERVQRIAPGAASQTARGVIDLYDDASIKRID